MENIHYMCRTCLGKGEINIFFDAHSKESIVFRLMACTSIRINTNDELPPYMCQQCLMELENAYNFRKKCEVSELQLKKYIKPKKRENVNSKLHENGATGFIKVENNLDTKSYENEKEDFDSKTELRGFSPDVDSDVETSDLGIHVETNTIKIESESRNGKQIIKKERKKKTKNSIVSKTPRIRVKHYPRKYMCSICGKTFQCQGNLSNHERVHSGEKPFSCEVCNRSFAQIGHLVVHKRTHTGIKPYKCEKCGRAFSISHALKKHLRTHTGERPFPCSLCEKKFTTSYHLSYHFKRHTGDKSFKCDWPDCTLGFVNTSEMKRHRARHIKPKQKTNN